MHARKPLLAAGSTVALVAGGVFFSAAPASAVHNSPECISAQDQFTAALHNAELNADLEVELAVALQNLVNAQATLDLLDVEGTATLEDLEVRIAAALGDVLDPQLPNINAIINGEGAAGSAVANAQVLLGLVANGDLDEATVAALLDLGIDVDDFALLDIAGLTAEVEAEVSAGDITREDADALLSVIATGTLDEATVAALLEIGIDASDFVSTDLVALEADLGRVIAELELVVGEDALAAQALLALLESGDLAGVLDAEAQLEALLGVDLDFSALISLETELLAALAVLDAQADLDAAIAVVAGLQVQLDALDIDLLELEALFDAAIEACVGAGAVVGGGDSNEYDDDHSNGAGGTGGAVTTGGGTGSAGGTNRGMNVQTAVPTASTDPAGIGALAAGIGFLVVAGAVAARRVSNS